MDNAYSRPRYPRHIPIRKRRRKQLLTNKIGQTFMRQTLIAIVLFVLVICMYESNTKVTEFISEKIEWVATTNVNMSGIYSSVQDSIAKLVSGDDEAPQKDASTIDDEVMNNEAITANGIILDTDMLNQDSSVLGAITFSEPVTGTIVTRFGMVKRPLFNEYVHHNGIDIEVNKKASVHAVLSGEVEEVGTKEEYGNYVIVKHDNRIRIVYGHCTKINVQAGETVTARDIIAEVEQSNSIPAHLHFEVWVDGKPVNPEDYINNII